MKNLQKTFVQFLGVLVSLAGYSQSTTISSQWFLPPRESYAKIKAIASPVTGMMAYDITNNCLRVFTGNSWDCLNTFKPVECTAPPTFTQKGGGSGSYNNDDTGASLAIDKNGNLFATGGYQGNAVFGTTTLTPLGGYGSDIFLAKYRPDSTVAWAVKAGGSNDDNGISVAVDTLGNAYITGYINSNATFYGTDAFTINKSASGYDMFVAKYNTNGVLQSVVTIPADFGYGITTDNSGNVYVTGEFSESFTINGTPYSPVGDYDAFLVKINSSGAVVWFTPFGGSGKDQGSSVFFDANTNKIFSTGAFSSTVNFGASTLNSAGGTDIFIARFDATTGTNEWAVRGGGPSDDRGNAIVLKNNTLFVTGGFQGVCTFGTTPITINSNGNSRDIWVASYSVIGNLNWITQAGGSGDDIGSSIATDNDGNIYCTGTFNGTANFGALPLTSAGSSDVFMTKLNPNGGFIQTTKGGGSGNDWGGGIAVDNCGVYLLGSFSGTAQFGRPLTSAGGTDIFLWKTNK